MITTDAPRAAAATSTAARRPRSSPPPIRGITPARLLDQAATHRLGDGRGALGDPELLVDRLQVRLHGRRAEVDELPDLGRRAAVRDELQHLALAGRQGWAPLSALT